MREGPAGRESAAARSRRRGARLLAAERGDEDAVDDDGRAGGDGARAHLRARGRRRRLSAGWAGRGQAALSVEDDKESLQTGGRAKAKHLLEARDVGVEDDLDPGKARPVVHLGNPGTRGAAISTRGLCVVETVVVWCVRRQRRTSGRGAARRASMKANCFWLRTVRTQPLRDDMTRLRRCSHRDLSDAERWSANHATQAAARVAGLTE